MSAPTADEALDAAAASPSLHLTSGGSGPTINPTTGLSTDYLNHFTEAVMVLEMAGTMPECLADLEAWQPRTYTEHFAASGFSNREALIAAYQAANPAIRRSLDGAAEALTALVMKTRDLISQHRGATDVETIAREALKRLRPLLARTAVLLNGATRASDAEGDPQAAIDAIFRA